MSGGLNLLLLDSVLDGLGIDQLLELLLLSDQEMVLMGISLGWNGVQTRGNILSFNDGDGEVGWSSGNLAGLVKLSLGRDGVQHWSNILTCKNET